jgi:hypothetical protein
MRAVGGGPGARTTLGFILVVLGLLVATPALAQTDGDLKWSASVAGRPLEEVDSNRPLKLGADDQVPVILQLENLGTDEIRVRGVRLNGRVMGMSFFSFTVRLDVVLPPGGTTQREFNIDLDALTDQANGYIPAYFQILNPDRDAMGYDPIPVDVQGSAFSVYGLFGISVALLTLALLASLLVSVYQGRLAQRNQWQRALQFLPVGVGVGLTLTFTLSALHLLIPSATAWLTLVLLSGGASFLIGYFLPLGHDDPDDPDDQRRAESDADSDQWPFGATSQNEAGTPP